MNKVILIDADSFLYKDIEDLEAYQDRIDDIITQCIVKTNADHYRVFIENPNNYTFRKILNPSYKSGRKGKPLPRNYNEIKMYIMEAYNPALAVGIETDDYIISTLKHLNEEYPLTEVVVFANDKDYKTYPMNFMDSYYGRYLEQSIITPFEASKNFAIQMLMGDSVDSVPCIDGLGKKKAEQIVNKCKTNKELLYAVWFTYLEHYKSRKIAKREITNNYMLLRLRDDVKYVTEFDKVVFE